MKKIGIIYSTVDGQTKKICEKIVNIIEQHQLSVELFTIDNFKKDIADYDTFIIGCSVRYGKHNDLVKKFIIDNKEALEKINTVFFSVNLVARKDTKNTPDTNPYLQKFVNSLDFTFDMLDVFAGMLDYKKYPFFDRIMIKLIMKMTGGPTKSEEAIEYTDWNRVKLFAEKVCKI